MSYVFIAAEKVRGGEAYAKPPAMTSHARKLLDEALQLPDEDRAELALRLLDSLGEPAEEVERAWIEEAKRRLGEIERGEVRTVPWSEARARVFVR